MIYHQKCWFAMANCRKFPEFLSHHPSHPSHHPTHPSHHPTHRPRIARLSRYARYCSTLGSFMACTNSSAVRCPSESSSTNRNSSCGQRWPKASTLETKPWDLRFKMDQHRCFIWFYGIFVCNRRHFWGETVKPWCFTIQNRVFWKIQVWDEMHVRTWVLDGVGML